MRANPTDNERKLFLIADGQGGYFTAKQARSAGYYNRLQYYHAEKGHWLSIDRGIYRLRNYPNSEREDLIRLSLWSCDRKGNPQAVFSHHTALAFHELGDIMPVKLHFTTPYKFRKKNSGGCVAHRANLSPKDIERHNGFFMTTPFRTLFDAYVYGFDPDQLKKSVIDAYKKGFISDYKIKNAKIGEDAFASSGDMNNFISYVLQIITDYRKGMAHGKK